MTTVKKTSQNIFDLIWNDNLDYLEKYSKACFLVFEACTSFIGVTYINVKEDFVYYKLLAPGIMEFSIFYLKSEDPLKYRLFGQNK